MSFDLYFVSSLPRRAAARKVESFLRRQPHVRGHGRPGRREWEYENPDTGASFSLNDEPPGAGDDDEVILAAGLNYFRPRFFAWEFADLVARLARAAKLRMIDGQSGPDRPVSVSESAIIRSWTGACRDVMPSDPETAGAHVTPRRLKTWWLYQRSKADTTKRVAARVFVPEISFLRLASQRDVQLAFVWSDAIPTLLPPTDLTVIYRHDRLPKNARGVETLEVLPTRAVVRELRPFLKPLRLPAGVFSLLGPRQARKAEGVFDSMKGDPLEEGSFHSLAPDEVTDIRPPRSSRKRR